MERTKNYVWLNGMATLCWGIVAAVCQNPLDNFILATFAGLFAISAVSYWQQC